MNVVKKIVAKICLAFIVVEFFLFSNQMILAKTNSIYKPDSAGVADYSFADEQNEVVIVAIGKFLYALTGYVEKAVARIFGIIIGSNMFPWADRLVFNTIPALDINYISPAEGSLFLNAGGKVTIIGKMIKTIYYMIFGVAIAFIGVGVCYTGIRLAISTIASEKARYKQAIQNMIFSVILIFTVHYLISFIFFVNEKIVEIAGNVLEDNMESSGVQVRATPVSITKEQAIKNVDKAVNENFGGKVWKNVTITDITMDFGNGNIIKGYIKFNQYPDESNGIHAIDFGVYTDEYSNVDITQQSRKYINHISLKKIEMNSEYWKKTITQNYNLNDDDSNNNTIIMLKMSNETKDEYWTYFEYNFACLLLNVEYLDNFTGINDYDSLTKEMKNNFKSGGFGYIAGAINATEIFQERLNDFFGTNKDSIKAIYTTAINAALITLMNDKVIEDYNLLHEDNKIELKSIQDAKSLYLYNYGEIGNNIKVDGITSYDNDWFTNMFTMVQQLKNSKYNPLAYAADKLSNNKTPQEVNSYLNAVIDVWADNNSGNVKRDLFTCLGKYFKNMVYGPYYDSKGNVVGYTSGQFNFIPALLYTIFVIQSIMYLVSYFRRLFYIIIMTMFAPLVVVYDFVTKNI